MVLLRFLILVAALSSIAATALAGQADVEHVSLERGANKLYRIDVTVRHADSGWDHYADRWEVLDPAGKVVAVRALLHPHVGEQPFTRSLYDVKLPAGLPYVLVRAHDKVHGYGGRTVKVPLP